MLPDGAGRTGKIISENSQVEIRDGLDWKGYYLLEAL
jgi:hypothetical protein